MKFDFIVQNPPYLGQLHLQIVNKMVNKLKDNGESIVVHPLNGVTIKTEPTTLRQKHINIIDNNKTTIKFLDLDWFPTIFLGTQLGITHIKKTTGDTFVKYTDGKMHKIDSVSEINLMEMPPKDYKIIKSFFENEVNKKGSLQTLVFEGKGYGAPYSRYAGENRYNGMTNKFSKIFTISKFRQDPMKEKNKKIKCEPKQLKNVYYYLNTKYARMALLMKKFDNNMNLNGVPLVDFNKKWNDDMLFKNKELQTKIESYFDSLPDKQHILEESDLINLD